MKSTIAALLCIASLGLGGCARQLNPNPVVPVTVVDPPAPIPPTPAEVKRTDLPLNWFEVKQSNWSYGLPMGFDRITLGIPKDILVQHLSVSQELTINFTTRNTLMTLEDYVSSFVADVTATNGLVLSVAKSVDADQPIVAVHSLSDIASAVGAVPAHAALDFFLQKNDTIYHMSCFAEGMRLKAEKETCFEVVSTLVIH